MESAGRVAIARARAATYPKVAPFHPEHAYPEYPFPASAVASPNPVYEAVRQSLELLGMDGVHYGSPNWNPLGGVVRPGDTVVVKPNFVMHYNQGGGSLDAVVTHPSVLRAVIDYVLIALEGKGGITVADAPQSDCRFDVLRERLELDSLLAFYKRATSVPVRLIDVRETVFHYDRDKGYLNRKDRSVQSGDPLGYVDFDLGTVSALEGFEGLDRLYGADYDRSETITAHRPGSHRYRISRTMLDGDVFISVPKLKTHRKVGITVNVKGLVGINGNKNFIVHHRIGSPAAGGDEYPSDTPLKDRSLFRGQRWLTDQLLTRKSWWGDAVYSALASVYRRMLKPLGLRQSTISVRAGDWWGNDTAWRMMIDLVMIILYADSHGVLGVNRARRFFSFVDGITGGQGEGPLRPESHPSGVIVAGEEPFVVDAVCARLMGLDFRRLRWLETALTWRHRSLWPRGLGRVDVRTNEPSWRQIAGDVHDEYLSFRAPEGWRRVVTWRASPNPVSLDSWLSEVLARSPASVSG